MSLGKSFWIILSLGILLASGQITVAEVMPPHPDHSWLFDEESGITAAPHSGIYNATLEAGASWSTDVPFSYGKNHAVNVSSGGVVTPGFSLGAAGTISMWARSSSLGAHRYLLDSNNPRTLLDMNLNSDVEVTWINGQPTDLLDDNWADGTDGKFSINQWHHIVIAWNNADVPWKAQIYRDGQSVAQTQQPVGAESRPSSWFFGQKFDGQDRWQGEIDEYAFWDEALSFEQVKWLSKNSIVGLPEPCSLFSATIGLIGLLVYGWLKRN